MTSILHEKIVYLYLVSGFFSAIVLREYYYVKDQQQYLRMLQYEYQKYLTYYKRALDKHNQHQALQNITGMSATKEVLPTKKILLQWPIDQKQFWISSKFGPRKKRDGSKGFHYGLDMAALKGTLVKAASCGIIREAGYLSGYGNCVVIEHTQAQEKITTRYAHLDSMLVKIGDNVTTGDSIGRVGNTGFVRGKNGNTSNATHLHFEVIVSGKTRIDPLLLLT